MISRTLHPFAVDVRVRRRGAPGYTWSIRQRGVLQERSITIYGTFEEARLAMKAALTEMVATWETTQRSVPILPAI